MSNSKRTFSTQTIVFIGVLIAVEIVLERIIAIPVGNITRFSLGKVAVILSGLWLGPIPGLLVGAISDVLGGLLQGYGLSINPFITLSSMMWGIIPAICLSKFADADKKKKTIVLCVSIVINAIVSTLCLTTAGLVIVYGVNFFGIMPTRLIQFAALTPTYCIATCLLYFSPLTAMIRGAVRGNN